MIGGNKTLSFVAMVLPILVAEGVSQPVSAGPPQGDGRPAQGQALACADDSSYWKSLASETSGKQAGPSGRGPVLPLGQGQPGEVEVPPDPPLLRAVEEPTVMGDPPAALALLAEPKRALHCQADCPIASLTSSVVVQDSAASPDPYAPTDRWQTDQAWRVKTGPVALFGEFGAGRDYGSEELNLTSRTGVTYKTAAWPVGEIQLRGGPTWACADPHQIDKVRDHAGLFVEMQCSWPLPGQLKAEYVSSAVPAMTSVDHDRVAQDFRVAVPLPTGGQLRVGAKHSWENLGVARPWSDGMELYLGLAIGK